jgi:hypothetical protein
LGRLKVKEKLRELGVDKQIHDLVTSKVVVQPTATPKPGKLPVSREEAITQLKVIDPRRNALLWIDWVFGRSRHKL